MAQLAHGPGFDLTDPLPGEVEVFAYFFERARFAPIQSETELEDLALPLVEG